MSRLETTSPASRRHLPPPATTPGAPSPGRFGALLPFTHQAATRAVGSRCGAATAVPVSDADQTLIPDSGEDAPGCTGPGAELRR